MTATIKLSETGLDTNAWSDSVAAWCEGSETRMWVAFTLAGRADYDGIVERIHLPEIGRVLFGDTHDRLCRSLKALALASIRDALDVLHAGGWIIPLGQSGWTLTLPESVEVK